jgi:CRISPR/Cas system-associated endonuclease Cas3-HD
MERQVCTEQIILSPFSAPEVRYSFYSAYFHIALCTAPSGAGYEASFFLLTNLMHQPVHLGRL